MTPRQTRLQETLDQLVARPGTRGALLVSRDGFCMMNNFDSLPAAETFSAMSATLVGAAEAAFAEFGSDGPTRVVIESTRTRMVAEGAGGEMLLVALTEASAPLDETLKDVSAATSEIARILAS